MPKDNVLKFRTAKDVIPATIPSSSVPFRSGLTALYL